MSLKPLFETRPEPSPQFVPPGPAQAREKTIRLELRDDEICVVTFDRPGSSANIFDLRTLDELAEELDFVARQTRLKGLIFRSAKPSIFIAGADLNAMRGDVPLTEVQKLIERGQSVMNLIAALRVPTAAAIDGAAVGGGFELCLACDYRVAASAPGTRIGLPETKLGLLPAWGGSTRLPRLIGLPKALDIILGGKTVSAAQALKLGMVDEVTHGEHLLEAATRMVLAGKPARPRVWQVNNSLAVAIIARRARREVNGRTRGNYPAVARALEVVTRGLRRSVEQSLALEREGLLELVQTEACRNLLRVFFLQERAKKRTLPGAGPGAETKPLTQTAVIGAGLMGAGIAQWLSAHGRSVILRDISVEAIQKGMIGIARLYQDGLKRGLFTPLEARNGLDRIHPAPAEVPLRRMEIVIEAAVEDLELKRKIFQKLDGMVSPDTMLATNTSALPVSEIAAATSRPERVLGIHFFNPVHRMQLVEVIAGTRTAPEVLQRAVRFAQQVGKLPVVVRDSPGFLVNRILMPYLVEAASLFENGARTEDLDSVMLDFGMPMGPLRLIDEVGLDVALHAAETLANVFPAGLSIPECLRRMTVEGMWGRKNGRGFYLHEKSQERPNPQALKFARGDKARTLPREELQERMVFLIANEAARCLEEAVVSDPADVDFAMVMGAGFAPFRGGPLRHLDAVGADRLAGAMEYLVANGAAQFTPCHLLADMAVTGKKFYAA